MATVENPIVTRWWWRKSSTRSQVKKVPPPLMKSNNPSLVNNNDTEEDASVLSLYSYKQTMASSIRAQHTRSEYSAMSDVESTTSIMSKPWISRNMTEAPLKTEDNDNDSIMSSSSYSATPITQTSSMERLDSFKLSVNEDEEQELKDDTPASPPPLSTKRRSSLVDYIVKAGLGRLRGSKVHQSSSSDGSQQQELSPIGTKPTPRENARRRSYG